jgi:hypothetical protein
LKILKLLVPAELGTSGKDHHTIVGGAKRPDCDVIILVGLMFSFSEKPICHNRPLIFSIFIQQKASSGFLQIKQQAASYSLYSLNEEL